MISMTLVSLFIVPIAARFSTDSEMNQSVSEGRSAEDQQGRRRGSIRTCVSSAMSQNESEQVRIQSNESS